MIKRYDAGREYAANISTPAITEQPEGAYVLYDDYAAAVDELRAEKAGLEAIVAAQAQELAKLRNLASSAWQPIETAPKDGTRIIVYRENEPGFESRRIGIDVWKRGGWWCSRRDMRPTHWMPLLPAPGALSGKSNA